MIRKTIKKSNLIFKFSFKKIEKICKKFAKMNESKFQIFETAVNEGLANCSDQHLKMQLETFTKNCFLVYLQKMESSRQFESRDVSPTSHLKKKIVVTEVDFENQNQLHLYHKDYYI